MARIRISEKRVDKRLEKVRGLAKNHKLIVLGIPIVVIGVALMLISSAMPHYVKQPYVTSSGQLSVNNGSKENFYFSNVENYKTIVTVSVPTGENVNYTLYTVHHMHPSPGITVTKDYSVMNGTFSHTNNTLILGSYYYDINYKIAFHSAAEPINFSANATTFILAKAQAYFNVEVTGAVITFLAIAMIVVDLSMEKRYKRKQ